MAKKKKATIRKRLGILILIWVLANVIAIIGYLIYELNRAKEDMKEGRELVAETIGVNHEITGADFDREMAVTCDNGTFVGREENEVRAYRGIPYAEPPEGALRWKPPVDAGADDGVYEAYYYGKSGIQTEAASERASFYTQGEDCLTLNVFVSPDAAPAANGEAGADDVEPAANGEAGSEENAAPKAVMVFFPGGAYGWGGTADPIYDGQHFIEAHKDVVLVTANYRIGLMGFMDFSEVPGGEDYKESGNLGTLDQVSALRWVQRNIAAFGGDPDNVTIFGESAGGSSVSLLPLVDDAKGLFHRAIAQSGSLAFTYSKEEARSLTGKLLKEAKASSMEDLLALDEETLMKINKKLNDYNNFPERDGVVLPEDLYEAYASGKGSDVEILSGTNEDEARYWIGEVGGYPVYRIAGQLIYGAIASQLEDKDKPLADAFLALQTEESIWNKTEFINDLIFRVPAIEQARLHTESGGRDYMYYWTKPSTIPNYGACHAIELAYVFNNLDDTIYTGSRADEKLAAAVQEMWVNFAKTGDPSTAEYHWDPYDGKDRMTMFLGDTIEMVSDPLPQQRVLIEPLLEYRFNGYFGIVESALHYLHVRILRAVVILVAANALFAGIMFIRRRLSKDDPE